VTLTGLGPVVLGSVRWVVFPPWSVSLLLLLHNDVIIQQRNKKWVCENVSNDGSELPGSGGRLMTPGHAIEAGWMLLTEAHQQDIPDLKKTAIEDFIMSPLDTGWDKENGGIFYFLDVDGHDPTQLEWSMKLWWVHNETLISLLMAYQVTRDDAIWKRFCVVLDYTLKHVSQVSPFRFGIP